MRGCDPFAAPPDPDEGEEVERWELGPMHVLPPDPLESIADSLHRLVASVEAHADEEKLSDSLRERQDDLEDGDTLRQLIEEVEAIVKPSTSKLANTVREAIARWKAPKADAEQPAEEPVVVPVANAAEPPPEPDADVNEWCAYARSLGYDPGLMNRSQIHTMLGIEQPVAAETQ